MSVPADGAPLPAIAFDRGELRAALRWYDPDDPIFAGDFAARLAAADAEVHVWLAVPDVGGDRDADVVTPWLSEPELTRRAGILHPRALAEFLAGRRLLRAIFGALLGVRPAAVAVIENRYGALSLDPAVHDTPWRFNISHTDGLIALAIARTRIGIDVEYTTRPGRTVELADRFFAPAEIAALRALPEARQRDRFFDLWTLKEAYIKARGMGLAIPLSDFAYHLDEQHVSLAVADATRDVPDASWRFRTANIGAHHRLAIAASP